MASLINAVPVFEPSAGDEAPGRASLLNGATALAAPPTPADAWDANSKAYGDWVTKERASGVADGMLDPATGWPTQKALVDAAQQYGSAMIGSTSAPGSGSTQIAGTAPMYSKAIKMLVDRNPNATTVLDYGAGLGLGADAMRQAAPGLTVHTLEPNVGRWKGAVPPTFTDDSQIAGKYDLITSTNVLNVLPQAIRDGVVRDIGDKLAPGGQALITTRGWSGDVGAAKNAVPAEEPNSVYVQRPGAPPVFQRGFTTGELKDYTSGLLGDGFSVEAAPFGKAGVIVTRDAAPPPAPPPGFTAFHGSPHPGFDQFSDDFIGSGEGAQAFGLGHYVAGKERVAQSYRDGLSSPAFDGAPYDSADPAHRAAFYIQMLNGGDRAAALSQIDSETAQMQAKAAAYAEQGLSINGTHYGQAAERLAEMRPLVADPNATLPAITGRGSMYEVRVNADPAHFLDWDKPRDQLAPNVQAFAKQNYPDAWENAADGSSLYQGMVRHQQAEYVGTSKPNASQASALVSQALRDAGVPGIRYLDGGSRSDGAGTSNHVVFDPATIEILRKYGIAGLMAGGGAAAATQGSRDQ